MRCASCERSLPDEKLVYVRGTTLCYPCFQRGQAFARRMFVLLPLLFLLAVGALVGVMIWYFPEITRR
jgi:hypothetical protein